MWEMENVGKEVVALQELKIWERKMWQKTVRVKIVEKRKCVKWLQGVKCAKSDVMSEGMFVS